MGSGSPTLNIDHFWFRQDNGSESGADFIGSEDGFPTLDVDYNYRLRFQISNSGTAISRNMTVELQRKLNAGSWDYVTSTSSIVKATTSSYYSDGDDTTRQLTVHDGFTYLTPNAGMDNGDGVSGGGDMDLDVSEYVEVEYCFQTVSGDVSDADTVYFRLTHDGGTLFDNENVSAYLTVNKPAVTKWLDGQSDGAAGVSGTIAVDRNLSGQSDGAATVDGVLGFLITLDGQADGSSSVAGDLSIERNLSGQSDGGSVVAGDLHPDRGLSGQTDGASNVSGTLSNDIGLNGQSDGSSVVSGTLSKAVPVDGQSDGVASVTGELTVGATGQVFLDGQSDGTSSVSGTLSADRAITGQSDGASVIAGVIVVDRYLDGQSDGLSTVAGDISLEKILSGQTDGSSSVTGDLTVESASEVFLDGQSNGVCAVTGDLSVEEYFSPTENYLGSVDLEVLYGDVIVETRHGIADQEIEIADVQTEVLVL